MERVITLANCVVKISVDRPGVYSFGSDSAKGKSYLCNLLNLIEPENITVLTSTKDSEVLSALNEFSNSSNELLIVDRYDLIRNDNTDSIIGNMQGKIILLDYKDYLNSKTLEVRSATMWYDGKEICIYA